MPQLFKYLKSLLLRLTISLFISLILVYYLTNFTIFWLCPLLLFYYVRWLYFLPLGILKYHLCVVRKDLSAALGILSRRYCLIMALSFMIIFILNILKRISIERLSNIFHVIRDNYLLTEGIRAHGPIIELTHFARGNPELAFINYTGSDFEGGNDPNTDIGTDSDSNSDIEIDSNSNSNSCSKPTLIFEPAIDNQTHDVHLLINEEYYAFTVEEMWLDEHDKYELYTEEVESIFPPDFALPIETHCVVLKSLPGQLPGEPTFTLISGHISKWRVVGKMAVLNDRDVIGYRYVRVPHTPDKLIFAAQESIEQYYNTHFEEK